MLEDVEVLGTYNVLQLAEYDPMVCLLALHCSRENEWSRYGVNDPPFPVMSSRLSRCLKFSCYAPRKVPRQVHRSY